MRRDGAGNGRARGYVAALADLDGRDEVDVAADKTVFAHDGAALFFAVVVAEHHPAADVAVLPDLRVAHIGQVRDLRAAADARVFDLDEIPDAAVFPDLRARAQMRERPHFTARAHLRAFEHAGRELAVFARLAVLHDVARVQDTALPDIALAEHGVAGIDQRAAPDVRALRQSDRSRRNDPVFHPYLLSRKKKISTIVCGNGRKGTKKPLSGKKAGGTVAFLRVRCYTEKHGTDKTYLYKRGAWHGKERRFARIAENAARLRPARRRRRMEPAPLPRDGKKQGARLRQYERGAEELPRQRARAERRVLLGDARAADRGRTAAPHRAYGRVLPLHADLRRGGIKAAHPRGGKKRRAQERRTGARPRTRAAGAGKFSAGGGHGGKNASNVRAGDRRHSVFFGCGDTVFLRPAAGSEDDTRRGVRAGTGLFVGI